MIETKDLEKKVVENLRKDQSKKFDLFYTGRYKIGPMLREKVFILHTDAETRKDRDKEAYVSFARYVNVLRSRENSKCVLVGTPAPFAIDIDEEIEYEQEKMRAQRVG